MSLLIISILQMLKNILKESGRDLDVRVANNGPDLRCDGSRENTRTCIARHNDNQKKSWTMKAKQIMGGGTVH